jgi:hypothetical protein
VRFHSERRLAARIGKGIPGNWEALSEVKHGPDDLATY